MVLTILLSVGLFSSAAPARRGPITLVQPNGYSFRAVLKGDEFGHVLMTENGCAVVKDSDGYYCYAFFDAEGGRSSSGIHVGDNAPSDALVSSRQIPFDMIAKNAARRRATAFRPNEESILKRIRGDKISRMADDDEGTTTTVEKHGLVILASFSDLSFTYSREHFVALLTEEGYSVNGATGSAKEYFDDQFNGMYDFSFTVTDIVTLSQTQAYYGGNDESGNDTNPEYMVYEACQLVDDSVDFSQFDDDGDGEVDNVFIFFAGSDEADGGGDDCIWSHAWYLGDGAGLDLTLDGVVINRYACTSELMPLSGAGDVIAGIGTFCHEYSHTFGLPDFYDTDYDTPSGSSIAAGMWGSTSLMDGGNANNNFNTPPNFNAVEREYLGLSEAETLIEGDYTLEPIHENGRYLKMETDTDGEYYLFECRSNDGWDAYINGGSEAVGMLVYHIDKSTTRTVYSATYSLNTTPYDRWELYNEVNANPEHQCADLVEADGRSDQTTSATIYYSDKAGLFFPAGAENFTPDTTPAFTFWSSYDSDISITDISMSGDDVVFTVLATDDIATPYAVDIDEVVFQDAAIISWSSSSASRRTAYATVSNDESTVYEITPYETSSYAFVCEGLSPGTTYTVTIWYTDYGDEKGTLATASFTTQKVPSSYAYPYIYFTTPANSDGSFTTGTKIPLRVFNATDAVSVVWTLGGNEISVGSDGYYTLSLAGNLRATITWPDGSTEVIRRVIRLTSN